MFLVIQCPLSQYENKVSDMLHDLALHKKTRNLAAKNIGSRGCLVGVRICIVTRRLAHCISFPGRRYGRHGVTEVQSPETSKTLDHHRVQFFLHKEFGKGEHLEESPPHKYIEMYM